MYSLALYPKLKHKLEYTRQSHIMPQIGAPFIWNKYN